MKDDIIRTGKIYREDCNIRDLSKIILKDFAEEYPNAKVLRYNLSWDKEIEKYRFEVVGKNEHET